MPDAVLRLATAAMGTRFEVALVARGVAATSTHLRAAGELAIAEIEEWHRRLTRFSADSWLSHVNRTAADEAALLDGDLWTLMQDAVSVWRDSGGAFDVARGRGRDLLVDAATRTVRFRRAGPALDMGAIGKGHALDCAARSLRLHGVTRAFLQGGSSSGLGLGYDPDGRPWRVRVGDDVLELMDAAFALSDDGSQPEASGGRHISDPRRPRPGGTPGRLPRRRVLVTGPSARLADAWSTALVVLGRVPSTFPPGYDARFLRSES
jgi:thiamine biosynthesis lipoprotein